MMRPTEIETKEIENILQDITHTNLIEEKDASITNGP